VRYIKENLTDRLGSSNHDGLRDGFPEIVLFANQFPSRRIVPGLDVEPRKRSKRKTLPEM
jgi:hypothetical protein